MKTQRLITSAIGCHLLILSIAASYAADEREKGTLETPTSAKAVAGSYYRGDGLGYNVSLTLKENGKYTAEWHGCLGKYGEASGTWSLRDKRITFTPEKEEDMMKGHLRSLDVLKFKGDWIFVPRRSVTGSSTTSGAFHVLRAFRKGRRLSERHAANKAAPVNTPIARWSQIGDI